MPTLTFNTLQFTIAYEVQICRKNENKFIKVIETVSESMKVQSLTLFSLMTFRLSGDGKCNRFVERRLIIHYLMLLNNFFSGMGGGSSPQSHNGASSGISHKHTN